MEIGASITATEENACFGRERSVLVDWDYALQRLFQFINPVLSLIQKLFFLYCFQLAIIHDDLTAYYYCVNVAGLCEVDQSERARIC